MYEMIHTTFHLESPEYFDILQRQRSLTLVALPNAKNLRITPKIT